MSAAHVKYEEMYLRAYEGVSDARASIGRYLDFYNGRRPHSSLDGITPDHAYIPPLPLRLAANPGRGFARKSSAIELRRRPWECLSLRTVLRCTETKFRDEPCGIPS